MNTSETSEKRKKERSWLYTAMQKHYAVGENVGFLLHHDDWTVKHGIVVRTKGWDDNNALTLFDDRLAECVSTRDGYLTVDIPNARSGKGNRGNHPLAIRLVLRKTKKSLHVFDTSIKEDGDEVVCAILDEWSWISFGARFRKSRISHCNRNEVPEEIQRELGCSGDYGIGYVWADIFDSPYRLVGKPVAGATLYFPLQEATAGIQEPVWDWAHIELEDLLNIGKARYTQDWRLSPYHAS